MKIMKNDPNMLEEYDFSNGVRGKYVDRYKEGTNIVLLEPELMEFFPDSLSVNEALKSLAKILKKYKNKRAEQVGAVDA
ncbi:MAG: hypothetical protein C4B57_11145 [Deltaproteobacteria bacterium]|nr:MAG: hypothetical protein C4B57_11145 [Deltaproteobacteria bacterium]